MINLRKSTKKTIHVVMYYNPETHTMGERWFNSEENATVFAQRFNTKPCPIQIAASTVVNEIPN